MNPNMIVFKRKRVGFFSQRKLSRETFQVWLWSTFVLMLMFVWVLGIYYVWTLNINATKGFTIRTLASETNALNIERDLLSVRVAEKESLTNIMSSDIVKSMEKIESFEYIVLEDDKTFVYKN